MSSSSRNLRKLTVSNASVTRRPFPSGPPSPTLTATTNASQLNLGAGSPETVITRRNLRESLAAYESVFIHLVVNIQRNSVIQRPPCSLSPILVPTVNHSPPWPSLLLDSPAPLRNVRGESCLMVSVNQWLTYEPCHRLKGVDDDASVGLQSAAGLHYLMANHWEVLVSLNHALVCMRHNDLS